MFEKLMFWKPQLTDAQLQALRFGCPDFDDTDVVTHMRSCENCTRTLAHSGRFSLWQASWLADLALLKKISNRPGE